MRLTIGHRLVGGIVLVVGFLVVLGIYTIKVSQGFLQESVGKASVLLAEETLARIDASIYSKLIDLQRYAVDDAVQNAVQASNQQFDEHQLSQMAELTRADQEWRQEADESASPLIRSVLDHPLSATLRRQFLEFYQRKYGYRIFEELFVTNRYGANVAATGRTTDYYQADEEWWQTAQARGFFIGDVEYDDSAKAYVLSLAVRIEDRDGTMLGVLKGAVSVDVLIREAELATKRHATTEVKLLTKSGQLMYSTKAFQFLADESSKEFFHRLGDPSGFFLTEEGGRRKLLSYAHSTGARDFPGLQWILIVVNDVADLLQPLFILRHALLLAFLLFAGVGFGGVLLIVRSITRPLTSLMEVARQVGRGNWGVSIPVMSRDELGELALVFRTMVAELSKTTVSVNILQAEVAARKKTQEELAQLLSLHTSTLEATRDGILVVDVDGHVTSYNQQFLELWRIPADLAAMRNDEKLLAYVLDQLVDPNAFLAGVRALYAHPEQRSLDLLTFKDGRIFERSSQPQRIEDTITGRVWSFHDITERRRAEERLSAYSKALEQSNRELDDFTFIVSHDLKEPLRSLDAFSKFLAQDYQDKLDDEGRGYLERIRANAQRMQKLIEDLLEVSRLSRRPNELQVVNVNELLEEVKLRFEYVIAERHVELLIKDPLPTLSCDRVRMAEVFANLLSNAIKYNDKPACRIEIRCRLREDGDYQFAVADNGPGIEPRYFEKIFEIFQRLGKKEEHEGTGVGLTIVKKVIELHKGTVWVESEPGQGTTVCFTIPRDERVIRGAPKLGAVLVAKQLITEEQLKQALGEQGRTEAG